MKVEYKKFITRFAMHKWCASYLESFTSHSRNLWCFKKGGDIYTAGSVVGFAKNVNDVYGKEVFLPRNCKSVGGRVNLCLILEADEVVAPVKTESLISLESEVVVEEVEQEASVELVFDLETCNAFEDKTALETYGKLFGIDLKKNKALRNMKSDLIKHVNG